MGSETLDLDAYIAQQLGRTRTLGGDLESTLRLDAPIDADALRDLERRLGWAFPEDYFRFVTTVGRPYLEQYWLDGGKRYGPTICARMLESHEILEIATAFSTWVADCTAEFEDDPEGGAAEQAVRSDLVPFQFIGDGTAWDLYCFLRSDRRDGATRVIPAYHDDEEMTLWAEEPDGDRVYTFAAHVHNWLAAD